MHEEFFEKRGGVSILLILTVCSFVISLLFLSSNFTGLTISGVSENTSQWIGFAFFLLTAAGIFKLLQGSAKKE